MFYDTIRIGVTSHAERTTEDPLTYGEREQVLAGLYDHAVYAIERPTDPDYVRGQLDGITDDAVVVTANPETVAFVDDLGYPVRVVPELGRLAFSGERIRHRACEGRAWRHLVPSGAIGPLESVGFVEIVHDVMENDDALSS